jgi:hypothetical protein
MRLERLEVIGFGRLQRRSIDFGERITVVAGPNESGKTTLHRAIRAALYGLDAGGPGRPRERSEWARWAPWLGDRYGVALTYRLASGARFRVAQSFDRGRVTAQVQELGGGDVTDRFRVGRSVAPGRLHLGVEEAVFCAAGWLGDDGLRLASPEAVPMQADRIREALERLADAGPDGATAAAALQRLREGLDRVGSERRGSTPLGVATAQLRKLDVDLDAARRRLAELAGEIERLHQLEAETEAGTEAARAAQRAWILGRLAQLDAAESEAIETAGEIAELTKALLDHGGDPAFPIEREAAVIALGGELREAERGAVEAEARWEAAASTLAGIRRRRTEIAAGLEALPAGPVPHPDVPGRAEALKRRLAVCAAREEWGETIATASARDDALRREIAVTGLGAVSRDSLDEIAGLVHTARAHLRRSRILGWLAGGVALLGIGGTAAAARWGTPRLAVWLVLAAVAVAVTLGVAAGSGARRAGWARRRLAERMPGADVRPSGIERLAAAIPVAQRLHGERQRQGTALDAARAEVERGRGELLELVDACAALAAEAGARAPDPVARGSVPATLAQAATALLGAVDATLERAARRQLLVMEDERLRDQEAQLSQMAEEARRRRRAVSDLETRLRGLTTPAGIDAALPPLTAVAAFREASSLSRERHDLATRLGEVRKRLGPRPTAPRVIAEQRAALTEELRRRGGDPTSTAETAPPDAARLAALEREATSAEERAVAALRASESLRARIEVATGSLPSIADLEDDRVAISAARDRARHQIASLERSVDLIERARREVHSSVAPRLGQAVSERLSLLTGPRYRSVNVDIEQFAVSLASAERDQMVPLELLSHGTRDQVSLLLRLSLCELLRGGAEPLPLLLDEPTPSSDPSRRSGILRFLLDLSATHQVVLTTSEPRIVEEFAAFTGGAEICVIDLGAPSGGASGAAPPWPDEAPLAAAPRSLPEP